MEGNNENQGALDALKFMIQTQLNQQYGKRNTLAESNRNFIVETFNHLAERQEHFYPEYRECKYDALKIDGEFPPFYGLYMISVRRAYEKYPIYVGYTSTRFDDRLSDHDVKHWHRGKEKHGHLEFDFIPTFNPSHAKFLESVFLGAFDFCRNKVENGQKREPNYNSHDVKPEESERYFSALYNLMVNDIRRLYDDCYGEKKT